VSDVLIDTGPLVAMLGAGDRDHAWTVERFRALPPPFLICEPVIAETCFVIERRGVSRTVMLERLENGLLRVGLEIGDHCAALKKLIARYANVPMSLADACLVRMSEVYPDSHIFTLDRDFRFYRRNGRQIIPTLTPER